MLFEPNQVVDNVWHGLDVEGVGLLDLFLQRAGYPGFHSRPMLQHGWIFIQEKIEQVISNRLCISEVASLNDNDLRVIYLTLGLFHLRSASVSSESFQWWNQSGFICSSFYKLVVLINNHNLILLSWFCLKMGWLLGTLVQLKFNFFIIKVQQLKAKDVMGVVCNLICLHYCQVSHLLQRVFSSFPVNCWQQNSWEVQKIEKKIVRNISNTPPWLQLLDTNNKTSKRLGDFPRFP